MNKKYKTMLRRMQEKERKAHKCVKDAWFVYILRCCDGSLYTGITKDIERRLKMHNDGIASRYTRTRRPVELCYHERGGSRTKSLIRECKIKALPRAKKEDLIHTMA